jgi:aldehyde dehydrogenase (NAD+)
MLIGGELVEAGGGAMFGAEDPYSGDVWAQIPDASRNDVELAVSAAREAFTSRAWRRMSPSGRGALLRRLAAAIADEADEIGRLETRDNGKLLRETVGQAKFAARCFDFFAGVAATAPRGEVIGVEGADVLDYTVTEPVGVCVLLLAWNSPMQFIANKAAPALAAGNTVVIKPSEHAAASALRFAELTIRAGLPPGVVNVVTGANTDVSRALIEADGVDLISLTGGVSTGRAVAEAAGRRLLRTVMELGGKSPNIVFADADLDKAVVGVMAGIFAAAGQTCIAGSRLLVQSSVHDRVVEQLADRVAAIRLGDPLLDETQMGPLANRPNHARVLRAIEAALADGAHLQCGGADAGPGGLFVAPTIFTDVDPKMAVAAEEIFGPVLSVMRFDEEDEALRLANDTPYGLAAGIWTNDISRVVRMTEAIEAGTVWVNTYRSMDPAAPFGGMKESGYGRERGVEALREFTVTKNVMIDASEDVRDPFVARNSS